MYNVHVHVVHLQVVWPTKLYHSQMDSVVDVGSAAYAQLQKIKGQSLDHADFADGRRNVCITLRKQMYM